MNNSHINQFSPSYCVIVIVGGGTWAKLGRGKRDTGTGRPDRGLALAAESTFLSSDMHIACDSHTLWSGRTDWRRLWLWLLDVLLLLLLQNIRLLLLYLLLQEHDLLLHNLVLGALTGAWTHINTISI